MRHLKPRPEKGFTIIELMIAMTLGLLLGGAVISTFVYNRHAYSRDESVLRMQDDARQAMRELANDLSMAGFWAEMLTPGAITPDDDSLEVNVDCGPSGIANWIYELDDSVVFVDNATGASANAAFSCIASGSVMPGTDVFAIKRLAGASTAAPAANRVHVRTNGTLGLLYKEPAASPAINVPAPFTEWEYRPRIYYLRNFGTVAGDGVPTLCRKLLTVDASNKPTMAREECLAQGIENLQIEFGLDRNGDGEPNEFVANPTAADLQRAVAARIYMLVRSIEPDFRYTNEKTYTIGNAAAYEPADNFYRRVYSITIGMRNLRTLIVLGS